MSGPRIPSELIGPALPGPESPVAVFGLPTRSQIEGFADKINALCDEAMSWRQSAEQLERSADVYLRHMSAPGGTDHHVHGTDA